MRSSFIRLWISRKPVDISRCTSCILFKLMHNNKPKMSIATLRALLTWIFGDTRSNVHIISHCFNLITWSTLKVPMVHCAILLDGSCSRVFRFPQLRRLGTHISGLTRHMLPHLFGDPISMKTGPKDLAERAVVEEGCFTPFLCGGIPLTFGGIN